MRELKFRTWSKTAQKIISWQELKPKFIKLLENEEYPYMQFTGLHDKNGKEVYEGDIPDENIGIRWNNKKSCFEFYWLNNNESCDGDINWYEAPEFLAKKEILGNVYENPELLNQQ